MKYNEIISAQHNKYSFNPNMRDQDETIIELGRRLEYFNRQCISIPEELEKACEKHIKKIGLTYDTIRHY